MSEGVFLPPCGLVFAKDYSGLRDHKTFFRFGGSHVTQACYIVPEREDFHGY
jgi:hypothetical protein